MFLHTFPANHRGHAQSNITNVVSALNQRGNRQQDSCSDHGMNHIANRNAHRPSRAALLLNHFRSTALGPFEDRVLKTRESIPAIQPRATR